MQQDLYAALGMVTWKVGKRYAAPAAQRRALAGPALAR